MSDQAQGLRTLADQVRTDHDGASFENKAPSIPTSQSVRPRPRSGSAFSESPVEVAFAVADARMHGRQSRPVPRSRARVLAVTSGKGGVGKSNFSTNLAITLGLRGKRVILFDADVGLANAHILLGASPTFTLEHVMHGAKTMPEVLHTAAQNVQLIGGGSGITEMAGLSDECRAAFLSELRELDAACDLIVIDTGAGVENNVLAFLCAVNEIVVVTTPEPTAIANAYATIKVVSQENPGVRLMLVVNMVKSSGEGALVAERLSTITRQFLNLEVEYVGCIPIDPAVPNAVRTRTPFVSKSPGCAASAGINQIIRRLGYGQSCAAPLSGAEGFVTRMQRFFRSRSTA